MHVIIDDSVDPDARQPLARAFELLCERLGIEQYNKTVKIIFFTPKIRKNGEKEGGYMRPDDDGPLNGKRAQKYVIALAPGKRAIIILALCHEMVHLRQYLTGVMSFTKNNNGRPIPAYYSHGVDDKSIDYDSLPYEKEPHDLMYPLAEWVIQKLLKEKAIFK